MQTTMSLEHKCGRLLNIFMRVSQSRILYGIVKVDFMAGFMLDTFYLYCGDLHLLLLFQCACVM